MATLILKLTMTRLAACRTMAPGAKATRRREERDAGHCRPQSHYPCRACSSTSQCRYVAYLVHLLGWERVLVVELGEGDGDGWEGGGKCRVTVSTPAFAVAMFLRRCVDVAGGAYRQGQQRLLLALGDDRK